MDLVQMKMAAGLQVTASDFAKAKTLSESVNTGALGKFWVVTEPQSHKDKISDVMFEVSSLSHLSHWMRELYKHDADSAHEIINKAKMFHDAASAKNHGVKLLAGHISDHHDKQDKQDKQDDSKSEVEVKPEVKPVAESTLNFNDDSNSLSWTAEEKPVNLVNSSDVDTVYKEPKATKEDPDRKVNVPAQLKSELKAVIAELNKDFQRAAIHDKNATGFYPTAIEVMQGLLDRLDAGTVEDIKQAQIDLGKVSGAFLHKVPDSVILFISKGGANRTLKDIFSEVKIKK